MLVVYSARALKWAFAVCFMYLDIYFVGELIYEMNHDGWETAARCVLGMSRAQNTWYSHGHARVFMLFLLDHFPEVSILKRTQNTVHWQTHYDYYYYDYMRVAHWIRTLAKRA